MKLITVCAIAFAVGIGLAAPAQALNANSWVSSTGSGSTCTRALPCGDFGTAAGVTAAGGVINCVDSANYGFISPGVSMTIDCRGTHATAALINVTTAGITVTVRGIAFEGAGNSASGIFIIVPATVVVEDCTVGGWVFAGGGSGNGVYLRPTGSGTSKLTLSNVKLTGNGNDGVFVDGTAFSSQILVNVNDSVIASNAGSGIATNASASSEIRLMMDGVNVTTNGIVINSNGSQSHVIVGRSTISENQVGFATAGGGAIYSYGTNQINGNNNDNVNVSTLISQN